MLKRLKWYEMALWLFSIFAISISFFAFHNKEYITLAASLIGVTALLLVGKGEVFGQILGVAFCLCYAVVSYKMRYWGEMITYLCMSMPIAVMSVVTWSRNQHKKGEVRVSHVTGRTWVRLSVLTAVVTWVFYYILAYFHTPNLMVSTFSIATSFMASSLTMLRSPYYALVYAANDIVLVMLWLLAMFADSSYAPMVICFGVFFFNDLYGFMNWKRMVVSQSQ